MALRQLMRFPGGLARAVTFSYDDGVEQDVKLVALFEKYGVKGTFNVNSNLFRKETEPKDPTKTTHRMTADVAKKLYLDSNNVEVACHGADHIFMDLVPTAYAMQEVINDRMALEKMFGKIVNGMAYAFGTYTDDVVEILRLAGIHYCRTTHASHNFDIPADWLRLSPTCHHRDAMMGELIEKFFAPARRSPEETRLFYIWGHSYEFDGQDNWEMIEDILQKVSGKDNVWYATNGEIYDYIADYNRLVYSADMTMVHNPTARDLFFEVNSGLVCVPAGKTVSVSL